MTRIEKESVLLTMMDIRSMYTETDNVYHIINWHIDNLLA